MAYSSTSADPARLRLPSCLRPSVRAENGALMIMMRGPSQVVMLISLRKPLDQQSTVPFDLLGLCPMKLPLTHPCFDA